MRKDNEADLYGIVYVSFSVWLSSLFLSLCLFLSFSTVIFAIMINSVCFLWPWSFLSALFIFLGNYQIRIKSKKSSFIPVLKCHQFNKLLMYELYMFDDRRVSVQQQKMQVKKEKRMKEKKRAREGGRANERKKNIIEQEKNEKKK